MDSQLVSDVDSDVATQAVNTSDAACIDGTTESANVIANIEIQQPQMAGVPERRLTVPADEQCLYHCVAAALNVQYYASLAAEGKINAAYYIKSRFVAFLRCSGKFEQATRLCGSGPGSYPTDQDMVALTEFIGGPMLVYDESHPHLGAVHVGKDGEHACLQIYCCMSKDGAGHKAPHYDLQQSWVKPFETPPYVNSNEKLPLIQNIAYLTKRESMNRDSARDDGFNRLRNSTSAGMERMLKHAKMDKAQDITIPGETEALREYITKKDYKWADYLLVLATAALAVYKMKPSHCGMSDHLKLLWIFAGKQFLRSHDGNAYYYDCLLGHFAPYAGILPYYLFDYLRKASLHLEGLFRSFSNAVKRDDESVLAAIASTFVEKSVHDISLELLHNALYNKGDDLVKPKPPEGIKGGGKAGDIIVDGEVDEEISTGNWYILLAKQVSRITSSLQSELMGSKLISLMIEWCDTPKPQTRGVAYLDFSYVYDDSTSSIKPLKQKSPSNDLYVGISRKDVGRSTHARSGLTAMALSFARRALKLRREA